MSRASNIYKRRLLRRRQAVERKRYRLPKQYYYGLKAFAGTAEFASRVAEYGNARAAMLSSEWYAEASQHPNFHSSRQCEIWIGRVAKSWQRQQAKRTKFERLAAKAQTAFSHPKSKRKPPTKKNIPPDKPRTLQKLSRDNEVYVVCTNNLLNVAISHWRLTLRHDAAFGEERAELARRIQRVDTQIRAKIFFGKIKNNKFAGREKHFDWNTVFSGALLEVEFSANGFESTWKARIAMTGNCNIIRGWRQHFLHLRSRMPVRFAKLVRTRLKECGKSHLIRDLNLSRLAA